MALQWDFNEKVGYVIERIQCANPGDEHTHMGKIKFSLYNGNAELICLWEDEDEEDRPYWSMHWFWTSRDHAKNMLGTSKEYKNQNSHQNVEEWHFYKDCKDLKWIISEILKSNSECIICIDTRKAPF